MRENKALENDFHGFLSSFKEMEGDLNPESEVYWDTPEFVIVWDGDSVLSSLLT